MKAPKRPVALMALAQVICALAVPFTLLLPLLRPGMNSYFVYMVDRTLAGLLIWVEIEAFCVCGRVRKSSAFSDKNVKALGRIALALCIAGVLTLLLGDPLIPYLLTGLPAISPVVERLLLPFMLLVLALMLRTVQVLMRRAVDMQEESDLTV